MGSGASVGASEMVVRPSYPTPDSGSPGGVIVNRFQYNSMADQGQQEETQAEHPQDGPLMLMPNKAAKRLLGVQVNDHDERRDGSTVPNQDARDTSREENGLSNTSRQGNKEISLSQINLKYDGNSGTQANQV